MTRALDSNAGRTRGGHNLLVGGSVKNGRRVLTKFVRNENVRRSVLKIGVTLLLLAAAFASPVEAQVTFVSQATAATLTSSPGTLSGLTVSGSSTMLLVGVSLFRSSSTTSPTVSGITWQGTALSQVCSNGSSNSTGNNTARFEIWSLANPAAGSGSVVITVSGTVTDFYAGAALFAGVGSLGTCNTTENGGGSGSSASVNVTVPTNGAAFDTLAVNTQNGVTISAPSAAQTSLWNLHTGTSAGAASYAGVVTSMSRSWSQNTSIWAYGAVPLIPAPPKRRGQVVIGSNTQQRQPGSRAWTLMANLVDERGKAAPSGRKGQIIVGRLTPIDGTLLSMNAVN